MKILFLSHLVPWPTNTGGKLVLFNYIKGLSLSNEVSLICFRQPDYSGTGNINDYCNSLMMLEDNKTINIMFNAIIGLAKDLPLKVTHFMSYKNKKLILDNIWKHSYDIIISQIEMAQFIPDSCPTPKILFMEDPEFLKFKRQPIRDLNIVTRFLLKLENNRVIRYEQNQSPRFDRVTLLSEEDVREYQLLLPNARLVSIPYGTDPVRFCPPNGVNRIDGMIVFSGNMYHLPNVAAVNHFCSDIFPLVKKEVPNASLWIVGANPVLEVQRWGQFPGITVTGTVPEISDYLKMARVSICPVSLKIGVQTKVLESMACGTPVVTTSAGNRGIRATSGDGLYIADSPDDFASRIVSLLNGEQWNEMSVRARKFIIENYTWDRSVEKLENLIAEVIHDHRKENIL